MLTQVPPQVVCSSGQVARVHTPLRQKLLEVQTVPQAPQLLGSFWMSTHRPLHMSSPFPHVVTHLPPEQAVPLGQACPHAPQLLLSDWRSAQVPLLMQSVDPV